MAKKTKITVQQHDNGIKLYFTIRKDGLLEPLNGAEVLVKFKEETTGRTLNRLCEITDAEMAECLYTLTSNDLSVAGNYLSEVQVTYSNGTKLSQENPIILIVTEESIENVDRAYRRQLDRLMR